MADVQRQFEQFHDTIRTDYDMNSTLADKRDIILRRIRKYLQDRQLPGFDELLQGSYRMKTGVVPIEGLEYDIDVGLRFNFSEDDYTAKTVRQWVFEAVDGHTEDVDPKKPCIRVTYADGYHVDLVVYARWDDVLGHEQFRLAHKTNGWRPADPPRLLDHVNAARARFAGTEDSMTKTDQFRRLVRYLRRWNDVQLPESSDAKPSGLAFVLFAAQHLQCVRDWSGKSNDRLALERLATLAAWTPGRLITQKPTPEYEDMFARLSDADMAALKTRFGTLAQALVEAGKTADPVVACKFLRLVFGDDFPVPPSQDTAKKTSGPAIVTSSSSA